MTNLAVLVARTSDELSALPVIFNTCATAPPLRRPCLFEGGHPMIDENVEQYVRDHEERVRKLDELYEKIRSPEYNEEEKSNFRYQSLKLCLEGLATV